MPLRETITGTSFLGSSEFSAFMKFLLVFYRKVPQNSRVKLLGSKSGFKSITILYLPLFISRIWAEALSTIGPETPKCVNSISPKILIYLFTAFVGIEHFKGDIAKRKPHEPAAKALVYLKRHERRNRGTTLCPACLASS